MQNKARPEYTPNIMFNSCTLDAPCRTRMTPSRKQNQQMLKVREQTFIGSSKKVSWWMDFSPGKPTQYFVFFTTIHIQNKQKCIQYYRNRWES